MGRLEDSISESKSGAQTSKLTGKAWFFLQDQLSGRVDESELSYFDEEPEEPENEEDFDDYDDDGSWILCFVDMVDLILCIVDLVGYHRNKIKLEESRY